MRHINTQIILLYFNTIVIIRVIGAKQWLPCNRQINLSESINPGIHTKMCFHPPVYSMSDGGGWSKMKVSFPVSSQSILKRFSRNFATIIIWSFGNNFAKFHSVFQKLDHLTSNAILRINRNEVNGFIHVIKERHK